SEDVRDLVRAVVRPAERATPEADLRPVPDEVEIPVDGAHRARNLVHAANAALEGLETAQVVVLVMLVVSRSRALLTPRHLGVEVILVLKRVQRPAVRRDELIDPPETVVDLLHHRVVRRHLVCPRNDATKAFVAVVRETSPCRRASVRDRSDSAEDPVLPRDVRAARGI